MNKHLKIVIAGAGVAGGSLAVRLALAGFAVTLVEREKYPRHKLCGEFVSPEALRHFRDLGVLDDMLAIGGERITETVFYAKSGRSFGVPSKWFNAEGEGALSISRAAMDLGLLNRAKALGVNVYEETVITGNNMDGRMVTAVICRDKTGAAFELAADVFIDATGRARVLARKSGAAKSPGTKVVAFKTHLRGAAIGRGACEIYSFNGGYCGLSRVENGAANCCFISNAAAVRECGSDPARVFREIVLSNPRAAEMMGGAEPVFDWIAVSIDSFGKKELNPLPNLVTVGDAAAFIDPFTGSGMLMALESSEILAACFRYSPDIAGIADIASEYVGLHGKKFARRLRFCELMRRASFVPHLAELAIFVLGLNKTLRHFLVRKTRAADTV